MDSEENGHEEDGSSNILILTTPTDLEPIKRLTKDLRAAAKLLSHAEVRYLVDSYYARQDERKRADSQLRTMKEQKEPSTLLMWVADQSMQLEQRIKSSLDVWSAEQPVGRWARSICGIGPVIAAGLLAHIDIERANTAGKIWRYAGLDPTRVWEKKTKRPWNAQLKTLCWKIGESFVKVSSNKNDIYGKFWLERKAVYQQRNEAGLYRDLALERAKTVRKDTEAYKHYSIGKLPPGHVHARAKRYAVKLFLAHYHHAAYLAKFGTPPPKPWIIEHGGHTDMISPPNLDMLK